MNNGKELQFGQLQHGELKKFQRFIKENWKNKHLYSKDATIFDWQHKGFEYYHCVTAKRSQRIIGVHCVIPLWQFDNNLEQTDIFLSLFRAIDGETPGIGLQLYTKVLAFYAPQFIGSVGIAEEMIPFHKRFGFVIGEMSHHVLLSSHCENYKIAVVPTNISTETVASRSTTCLRRLDKNDLVSTGLERLYTYQVPKKSSAYIVSRYLNHPVYSYRIYGVIRDGRVEAFGVIRLVVVGKSVALRLVDYVGPDNKIIDFFDGAHDLLRKYTGEYLDFYSYGISERLFKEAGVLNRKEVDHMIIPDHFEPFVQKNQNLLIAFSTEANTSNVRLFKGDGDQDRPNRMTVL
jgi:hypothetical protein